MSYTVISINDKDFENKLTSSFMEDGVAVITDVFSKEI